MTAPGPPRFDELAVAVQRSERGRLLAPDLDDRRWQDLVDEASALIDRYSPQWTDRNPSDIGMTLVELFAWLVESLIYRLNRVPEKHYVAFLDLLGITRAPMRPARTLLTFTPTGDRAELPAGTQAQTPGSETEAPIVFETETAVTAVQATVTGPFRVDDRPRSDAARRRDTALLGGAPAGAIAASLARNEAVGVCIALDTAAAPATLDLYVEPWRPPRDRQATERVEWRYTVAAGERERWGDVEWGPWRPLDVLDDGTGGLVRPGVVRLRVPAGVEWAAQDPGDADAARRWTTPGVALPSTAARWLGLRVTNVSPDPATVAPLELRLDRLLPNTTTASSVGTVTVADALGEGTDGPHRVVRLAQAPLYARPGTDTPYDHLRVEVGGTPWRAVDSLPDGPGECFLLDPVSGEITFGDHDPASGRGRGSRPRGAIVARHYRYVSGGARANVPAHTLSVPTAGSAIGATVDNPLPATGGVDEEPIEETKRRAPEVLRHRDRAVTAEDYELLAVGAAPGIAQARCLTPRLHVLGEPGGLVDDPWTFGDLARAPGVVHVLVVPDLGPDVPRPEPSLAMRQDVIRVLDRSRPIATSLVVGGPRYVTVKVVAEVTIFPTAESLGLVTSAQDELNRIAGRIAQFLHPVHGRVGQGWQIGQSVYISDLYQAIRPAEDVGFVTSLALAPEQLRYVAGEPTANHRPLPLPVAGEPVGNHVRVADYELVCAGTITVRPTGAGGP